MNKVDLSPADILHNLREWDSEILGRYKMEDYEREALISILEEVVKDENKKLLSQAK